MPPVLSKLQFKTLHCQADKEPLPVGCLKWTEIIDRLRRRGLGWQQVEALLGKVFKNGTHNIFNQLEKMSAAVLKENITATREEFKPSKRSELLYSRLEGEDAKLLDRMFNKENCLVEVNPGKVLLPAEYEEVGDRIRNMEVRPDDVWLVSYPRTGSTWAQEMVWCIANDLDFDKARTTLQQLRTPLLELTVLMAHDDGEWKSELGNSVELVEKMPSPRFIKTHLPLELLPKAINTVKPKIVYVARNPKDMCVSYYHYCKLVHNMEGSFQDFCDLFLKDKVPIGPIWNHYLGFWRRRNDSNILFLKYEDMKRDHAASIRKTAEFLGKTLSDAQVSELADYLSFGNMKKNPAVNLEPLIAKKNGPEFLEKSDLRFIRKGQVGDWKNHMSPELISRFDSWTEEHTRGTGLSFD